MAKYDLPRKIQSIEENSAYIGELPKGCRFCGPGQKMVLLITGKCQRRCYYCPLSMKKRGKNVIYANELKVDSLDQIIEEAKAISAKGTGITGGDPLLVPQITIDAIELLKSTFGEKHHIHLYTTGNFDIKLIKRLAQAGLDELRLHPPIASWGKYDLHLRRIIDSAKQNQMSIGAEIPIIPDHQELVKRFIMFLNTCGAEFINLNELEFSESNWKRFNSKGFKQKDAISSSVLGSEIDALDLITELANCDALELSVHYCSARFKDRQQLTNRLKRRAKNVIRPFEVLTDDGTFLLGVIDLMDKRNTSNLEKEFITLKQDFQIPDELIYLDLSNKRIELASWILKEVQNELSNDIIKRAFITEEYPTADRLEVERIPLSEF